jgi:hypothetical protein
MHPAPIVQEATGTACQANPLPGHADGLFVLGNLTATPASKAAGRSVVNYPGPGASGSAGGL